MLIDQNITVTFFRSQFNWPKWEVKISVRQMIFIKCMLGFVLENECKREWLLQNMFSKPQIDG